jgi:hypothetical protein
VDHRRADAALGQPARSELVLGRVADQQARAGIPPILAAVASTWSVYDPSPANATTTRWNGPCHWNEPTSGTTVESNAKGKSCASGS